MKPNNTVVSTKRALRAQIRQQRRQLSHQQCQRAAFGLVKSARQCRSLWFAGRILSYAPFEGEISPANLLAQHPSNRIYQPKITHYRTHTMRLFKTGVTGRRNRFGIQEPGTSGQPVFANQLDLVLLPLVAFDRSGNRLGMGAGYYDRALQSLGHQVGTRPLLIGLAHAFQEMDNIDPQAWDVPLDAILTDHEYIPVNPQLLKQPLKSETV